MNSEPKDNNVIEKLHSLSLLFKRWQIPYLTRVLDILYYCGIKLSYQGQAKENQIVALAFFLQNIKGMTKAMSYKQLIAHIKASTHNFPEFKANTRLFEIIYGFKCETKETFKAIFVSNQLLMDSDAEGEISNADFAAKIKELFLPEDVNNGVITLEFLIRELENVHNALKEFFFFFNKYLQGAKTNAGLITSKLIDNPIAKKLLEYKGKWTETYEKLNPMSALVAYYTHYADLYQINERYTNAKKYISDGVASTMAVPLEWTHWVIKPLDNMKVIVLERVIKLKTDLSSVSDSSRTKVIEFSNDAIKKFNEKYDTISAWVCVKGNEINVVVRKKFASLNSQWLLDYIQMIKEINCYETLCNSRKMVLEYCKQLLSSGEESDDQETEEGDKEERKENLNVIQKPIELELTFSMIQGDSK